MKVGTLIEQLQTFDPERPVALMVPTYAEKIPVEVVQVVDGAFLPDGGLVARDTFVVVRAR